MLIIENTQEHRILPIYELETYGEKSLPEIEMPILERVQKQSLAAFWRHQQYIFIRRSIQLICQVRMV